MWFAVILSLLRWSAILECLFPLFLWIPACAISYLTLMRILKGENFHGSVGCEQFVSLNVHRCLKFRWWLSNYEIHEVFSLESSPLYGIVLLLLTWNLRNSCCIISINWLSPNTWKATLSCSVMFPSWSINWNMQNPPLAWEVSMYTSAISGSWI